MQSFKPRVPVRERHLPSFTLVLTQAGYPPSLPAHHRSSPRIRFHPYPRCINSRDGGDPLMMTVDHRYDAPHSHDELSSSSFEEENIAALNLQNALNDGEVQHGSHQRARPLSILVIDLALAVTHKLRYLRVVKDDQTMDPALKEYTPAN